nr:MAG TPA: hypothetical protein [Caudoviricetes sp.]
MLIFKLSLKSCPSSLFSVSSLIHLDKMNCFLFFYILKKGTFRKCLVI